MVLPTGTAPENGARNAADVNVAPIFANSLRVKGAAISRSFHFQNLQFRLTDLSGFRILNLEVHFASACYIFLIGRDVVNNFLTNFEENPYENKAAGRKMLIGSEKLTAAGTVAMKKKSTASEIGSEKSTLWIRDPQAARSGPVAMEYNSPLPGRPSNFHVMTKAVGPICNLDCKYCFYLEKERLYPEERNWAMPDALLEEYIRQYIESQQSPTVSFAWQGGEPTLLGVEYFRNVVKLQTKYSNGKQIENALQTNGLLLDDDWAEFLALNNFLVGLSVDGPAHLHDCYRVDKGNRPTFDRVMRGIGFLKKHCVQFNTLTVVHRTNSYHPLEVYRFLKEIGSGFMQFIPIVERIAARPDRDGLYLIAPSHPQMAEVSSWSVEPLQYGNFLCAIFDEWVREDVGRYFVQLFDVALEAWAGLASSLCIFRPTCGTALALEHNGDLYSCDHFVYPKNKLGNIMEQPLQSLVNSKAQQQFGNEKCDSLPQYCRSCDVRFACNGECPKHRFTLTPDGEAGLNYLCAGYQRFFRHIDPYMKYMAFELRNRRPPANVMEWICLGDLQRAPKKHPGRNDPCPCGSGRKYKKCCGKLPSLPMNDALR